MKFFVIIKEKSTRVPNKSFRKLGGFPLWKHLIFELIDKSVYIDTDSSDILKECDELNWVTAYKRKQEHIDLEVDHDFKVSPVLKMINRFLDEYVKDENEVIVTPHITSPFIKIETINSAANMLKKGYDSVQACIEHQEFAYVNGRPVNFDPSVVQKTQDLTPVVMGNGAFFIFTKKMFKKYMNRVGENTYHYPLSFRESIEIDNEEDFELAKKYVE
jgi:CMP-N-acetylneuraminic acid synthetase